MWERNFSKSHYDSHKKRKTPCKNNNDKINVRVLNNKIENEDINADIIMSGGVKYIDLFGGMCNSFIIAYFLVV